MRSALTLLLACVASAETNQTSTQLTPVCGKGLDCNIVQLAQSVPDLSTLVSALIAGKLTTALSGTGPFTVFAPTNEGFAKLPSATLAHLLDPANIKELDDILEYHVISGSAIYSKDLKVFQQVKTLEGGELKIAVAGRVFVNNATVTKADNAATNGVVHIIDSVLIPPAAPAPAPGPPTPPTKTIVDLAVATPSLSTLVTALKAGKLVDTLSGAGPFTVFAPTNDAFDKLPAAILERILDPANIKELDDILTYHVVSGSVQSKDLTNDEKIKTIEGNDVEAHVFSKRVFINNAEVTTADVEASNGVIHIVDAVLLPPGTPTPAPPGTPTPAPPSSQTIVDLAVATPSLSTLVTALKAGKLVDTLSGAGPFTVFAPNNDAFNKIPAQTLERILDPANIKELDDILTYHVASGSVHAKDLKNREKIKTVEGKDVEVFFFVNNIYINNAEVVKADIDASNGVIHIIKEVLIPGKISVLRGAI